MKLRNILMLIALLLVSLVFAGCGSSSQAPAPQNTAPAKTTSAMPNEDPNAFIKDMTQALITITEQSKVNRLDDAKKAAGDLVAANEKLAVHITDTKMKDDLKIAVQAVQSEVQKPSPSQSAIDKGVQSVKTVLGAVSNQLKGHKHQ